MGAGWLAITLGLGILIGLGVLFAWRRSHPDAGAPAAQRCWPCCRSRTWATRPTPTSPTAWPMICARSCPRSAGLAVIARSSSNEYRRTTKKQHRSPGSWASTTCSPPQSSGKRSPGGASRVRVTPGAGRRACRSRAADPLGAAVRRRDDRRVPGAGRHCGPGGAGVERGARRQRQTRAGLEADPELARLRGVPAGRGRVAGDERERPAESPPGDCGVRAGGGARSELCPGLGAARAGAGIPVWQ